jgi:DNA-binding transcriptional ArsR family regulator
MSLEVNTLRALAHPIRLRILSLLTAASMSAADLARELDITQANASYHLRQLAAVDLVVEAGERKIRGGVAKLYRYPLERAPAKLADDDEARQLYAQTMATEMVRRYALQQKGKGTFTDAELWVDPEVWNDVVQATADASRRLHTEAKLPRTEGTVRVSMTTMLFEMRSTSSDANPDPEHDPDPDPDAEGPS